MERYLINNKKTIALYSLMAVAAYAFLTLLYQCYAWITDTIGSPVDGKAERITIASIVILIVLLVCLNILAVVKRTILYEICRQFRSDVLGKAYQLGYARYRLRGKEYYESILLNDIQTIEEDYFSNVIEFLGDSVQLVIMLAAIGMVGVPYLLVVLVFAIPSVIHPFLLRKKLEKRALLVSEEKEDYTKETDDLLRAFELYKSAGKEQVMTAGFRQRVGKLEASKLAQKNLRTWNSCLMALCVYLLKAGSQMFFTYHAVRGVIAVATVSLLFGLANNVGNPVAALLGYLGAINGTKEVREKCWELLGEDAKDQFESEDQDIDQSEKAVSVSFDKVQFGYTKEKQILNGFTFCFESGKKYALYGASGCGKSTVFRLIKGYCTPDSGHVMIGQTDVTKMKPDMINRYITYISQVPFVFAGTIRENLAMFREDHSDQEMMDALEAAGLADLIRSLPGKLDEEIKEGGKNFSGGEKQRITIARALLHKSAVLLVDEGTSALDNETAYQIEQNLLSQEGRTVISINHRVNDSVRLYDEIVMIQDGRVVEHGPYELLMEARGAFYKMWMEGGAKDNEA
ncbi:MAG: ABC transporter ATP-binding protein/permease [Lachnospiraceae bacterium]|nr:ABC transporter ATP-binding protein/permease [Lachnospiraceae bacterium]MDE7002267.1 ABC transporter ATP-binding protein/permease [Lachnospiraceae bacterium]